MRPPQSPFVSLTNAAARSQAAADAALAAARAKFLTDFADGRMGVHHNTYQHRSRLLRHGAPVSGPRALNSQSFAQSATDSVPQHQIREHDMAKGQQRSSREARKPKKETPPKPNASKPSMKGIQPVLEKS